ncbi:hypothetical protein ABIA35_001794 [Catenulispora sp. MAP12-49]
MTSSLRRNRSFLVLCADQLAGSLGRRPGPAVRGLQAADR